MVAVSTMPLIGLDARKMNDFGIGTYIRNLIREFASQDGSRRFMLYLSPEDLPGVSLPASLKSASAPYGKYSVGEIFGFGRQINRDGVSVFHSPHYTLPGGLNGRSVVTIHDLIHLRFPEIFSAVQRAYSYGMMLHAIHHSQVIITDSEFTKKDILRSFRIREEKIVPIPLGVSEYFHQPISDGPVGDFRARHTLQKPYVLFVGNTKPHKGLTVLLRAFKETLTSFPGIELVIAGGSLIGDAASHELLQRSGLTANVRLLGRLSEEDLRLAYKGAEVFVLPSLYEGFGLPALEAMACGVPVIVSDAASLPEVVGDGALVCTSGDHRMFSDAMTNVLRDPRLRASLIQKGKDRSSLFSWQRTAQRTLAIYDSIS